MFIVTPQEIQFFKVFIGKLVELTQESLMLGFPTYNFGMVIKLDSKNMCHPYL